MKKFGMVRGDEEEEKEEEDGRKKQAKVSEHFINAPFFAILQCAT